MRNSKSPQKENGIVYANIGFIFSAFSCFYSVCLLFAFLLRTIVIHITSIQYISGFFTYQILGFTLSFITAATALILSFISHKKGCKNERKKLAVIMSSISLVVSIVLTIISLI